MPVVPIEAQRVAPDRFDVRGARLFFKHWQRARRRLYWLPGFAIRLFSLVITQRARASVSQERKRIRGLMAILPRDDQAAAAVMSTRTDFGSLRRSFAAIPISAGVGGMLVLIHSVSHTGFNGSAVLVRYSPPSRNRSPARKFARSAGYPTISW